MDPLTTMISPFSIFNTILGEGFNDHEKLSDFRVEIFRPMRFQSGLQALLTSQRAGHGYNSAYVLVFQARKYVIHSMVKYQK